MIDLKKLTVPQYQNVLIEALGGEIRLKTMQAREHLLIEQFYMGYLKDGQLTAKPLEIAAAHVRLCVVDEDGQAIFDEQTIWDLPRDVIYTIFNHINQADDALSQTAVEDAAKN